MKWTSSQTKDAFRLVRRYGRAHRRWLVQGLLATVAVVVFRLALPWPLKWALELVVQGGSGSPLAANWQVSLSWIAAAFVSLSAGLGYAEFRQRVAMKQYAAATVHSLREDALRLLTTRSSAVASDGPGLISRVIGDTARIKAELSGILLHASQNGLLYLGICVVFLVLSPKLGLFFLSGGLLTVVIGVSSGRRVAPVSLKQREKEGDYASVVQNAIEEGYLDIDGAAINEESEARDVGATRIIARSTGSIHVTLALVTAVALWIAFIDIQAGRLTAGDLFLFMAYVLTVQRRMVQFGRQTARTGKLVANLTRLGELIDAGEGLKRSPLRRLQDSIELRGVGRRPAQGTLRKSVLKNLNTVIRQGDTVALLGPSGSGKSALLRVLAGFSHAEGEVVWDGQPVRPEQLYDGADIAFLPQVCVFRRQSLGVLMGADRLEDLDPSLIKALGLSGILRNAVKGLETKLSSSMLTAGEARGLVLYSILTGDAAGVWLLDGVTEGLSRKKAVRLLETVAARGDGKTVVVCLPYAVGLAVFTRVLALKQGRLAFDGTVKEWETMRGR